MGREAAVPAGREPSDMELVSAWRSGDQNAFSLLLERYKKTILAKISAVHSDAEADDLAQECALGLLDAAESYDRNGGASFHTYASVCMDNRLRSAVRRSLREKNLINSRSSALEEEMPSVSQSDDPEKLMLARESAAQLWRLINEFLSPTEYNVLMLSLSGCSYAEIARRLDITVKSVDNALQRVRHKIKDAVSDG